MKKYSRSLIVLLLCMALFCGMSVALAEEVEIELVDSELDALNQAQDVELDLDGLNLDLEVADVDDSLEGVFTVGTDEDNNPVGNQSYDGSGFSYYIDDNNVLTSFYADEDKPPVHFDIPEGVIAIDSNAFGGRNIKSVTIPSSVKSIGDSAFHDSRLESIMIPGTVKSVGYDAFRNCRNLKTATIMDGVETLGHYLFMDCASLESAYIPGSVKSLEYQSFQGCTALKEVTIGNGVENLGNSLFYECRSLKKITIPGSVTALPNGLFSFCTSLESVILSEGVKTMTGYTFDCVSLTDLVIPGSMKTICANAFAKSPMLKNVTINNGVETIEYQAFNCRNMAKITIPESVKAIGNRAVGYTGFNNKVEGFIICGKAGSAAEEYAEKNSFEFDDGSVKPKRVTITKGKSAEIEVDKTLQLKTKLSPTGAKTTLTWKSSNEKVATVSEKGLVRGVAKGKATIKVTTKNGKTAKITIKVVGRKPSKVTITNGKKATIKVGKTLQLKTKLSPDNAESKLTWQSSNTKVATVSGKGLVSAKKAGTATITVKTANGKKATIKITVK